ncbi:uncharacterized protein B0P05DRAFT_559510 [Gilbertella persicaria]|uniref:Steroid 5-alpha reductase C-terminal domain-containing protein n=1 Tax=Rhizopus stolonifer TaxID=4846 RepID=A0A367KV50_RHIST|nr:uncharacterized protein B0P05DRAFT_559510 [Gilbertella persicaria]KAI8058703.1 hypothetical protein B0P05DRAFT_559510 [Gilbertella persicaria]RCI06076.1 hypothetical protein CU098_012752 [Rhizopus stolonifer]
MFESITQWLIQVGPKFPPNATWDYAYKIIHTAFHNLTSAPVLSSFVSTCLSHPSQLIDLYKQTDPLETSVYVSSGLAVIHYILSEITKNYSQVDKAWSILPGMYAWHFTIHDYLVHGSFHPRLLTASILITIWGSRLTYNFARKGGYHWTGQDYRYPYIREKIGAIPMALLNLVFIAPMQDYLLLLMVTPLYITNSSAIRSQCLTPMDWLTVFTHLTFLTIEVVADEQQYFFQTEKHALLKYLKKEQLSEDYRLGFLWHSGLFQYSRHANFFAEQCMWWTIYLFSVSAVQEESGLTGLDTYVNWTVSAPIFLSLLFQGSTWLTEKISLEKYPEYADYCKSVNRFIPWFPSKTVSRDKKDL